MASKLSFVFLAALLALVAADDDTFKCNSCDSETTCALKDADDLTANSAEVACTQKKCWWKEDTIGDKMRVKLGCATDSTCPSGATCCEESLCNSAPATASGIAAILVASFVLKVLV